MESQVCVEETKELDYLHILKALKEIPFGIGKKLLTEFLQGIESNESIIRNRLYEKDSFGSLAYDNNELSEIIDELLRNGMIQQTSLNGKTFWKVLEITKKGREEINYPSFYKKRRNIKFTNKKTEITQEDKKMFEAFGDVLLKYNDEQKKTIISKNPHILCLAGAGSGKTTVLTKRIDFLVKYRSINPKKILAVTFTRKARQEMISRLNAMGQQFIMVETFNSFCEKILKKYNDIIYEKPVRVISYRDKILMINKALRELGIDIKKAVNIYFPFRLKRGKTEEQLANVFLNDCFFIRDYFKFKNKVIELDTFEIIDDNNEKSAKMVIDVCNYIEEYMQRNGLRDFADQLMDTIKLFENNKEVVPQFDHILIDEYQDVNSTQTKLINLLNPKNLFAVGDPRQSIYGWRGSDIKYILNFENDNTKSEIITLTKNYRSTNHIVELINKTIKNMGLANLESVLNNDKDIKLISFNSENAEFEFVIQRILKTKTPRNEIFILARTNRQLNELSTVLRQRNIKHIVRSDEIKKTVSCSKEDITLATIHAIKGLEAKMVFVIGANSINFPCKGSEHPVVDMVKVEEYDKYEEERRLFYVALSRAKNSLYITYTGKKPTPFLTKETMEFINSDTTVTKENNDNLFSRLKEWRKSISLSQGIPSFMIMHDKTLIDIAVKAPLTTYELEEINGLGPAKIQKYGDEILKIISI